MRTRQEPAPSTTADNHHHLLPFKSPDTTKAVCAENVRCCLCYSIAQIVVGTSCGSCVYVRIICVYVTRAANIVDVRILKYSEYSTTTYRTGLYIPGGTGLFQEGYIQQLSTLRVHSNRLGHTVLMYISPTRGVARVCWSWSLGEAAAGLCVLVCFLYLANNPPSPYGAPGFVEDVISILRVCV